MTKQEAEALAVRLHRVWAPERHLQNQMEWRESLEYAEWEIIGLQFQFFTWIQEDVFFLYVDPIRKMPRERQRLELSRSTDKKTTGGLEYDFSTQKPVQYGDYDDADSNALYIQFAAQWLPFFRRGCWLSGCSIEASAHEKAEWIQDFSREEIEAWDLKF